MKIEAEIADHRMEIAGMERALLDCQRAMELANQEWEAKQEDLRFADEATRAAWDANDKVRAMIGDDNDKFRATTGDDNDNVRDMVRYDTDKVRATLGDDNDKVRATIRDDNDKV
jgi:hypothetical protein